MVASMTSKAAFLLVLASLSQGKAFGSDIYKVPTFNLAEMASGTRAWDLADVLRSSGLISIDLGESRFAGDRKDALDGICKCAHSEKGSLFQQVSGADTSLIVDVDTTRSTFATATIGDTPLSLPTDDLQKSCGSETAQAMESLRDHVAMASRAFVSSLDRLRRGSLPLSQGSPVLENTAGQDFYSIASVVRASTNLEHFHLYSRRSTEARKSNDVLPLHTDAGLFLSFIPGLLCGDANDESAGESLLIEVNGTLRRAEFRKGTIGIMLGVGAEHWLENMGSLELHAARHAVEMSPGTSRAWYGTSKLAVQRKLV